MHPVHFGLGNTPSSVPPEDDAGILKEIQQTSQNAPEIDKFEKDKPTSEATQSDDGITGIFRRFCAIWGGDQPNRRENGSILGKEITKNVINAREAGWQGKALRIGGEAIEDQNALVFCQTKKDGNPQSVIRMKIRPQAESGLLDILNTEDIKVAQISKGPVKHAERILNNGRLSQIGTIENESLFYSPGSQINVHFLNGAQLKYIPWNSNNLYAQKGELEMVADGYPTPLRIEGMLKQLEELGLKTHLSTSNEVELMYLKKMAYIRNEEDKSRYRDLLKSLENKTTQEQVEGLRAYWEKELGISILSEKPEYNPEGQHQYGFLKSQTPSGYNLQYRFDISQDDLEREMAGYTLLHQTYVDSMANLIDVILSNNGAMISTKEKLRLGITPKGLSPEVDMGTGGASYFFTRLNPPGQANTEGFHFKKDMLRRMDAISYDSDMYGNVKDNFVKENRHSTIDSWKKISHYPGNETIFKNSVTFLDNIDYIVADSKAEREAILEVFATHGISKLPDGRSIEEAVRFKA